LKILIAQTVCITREKASFIEMDVMKNFVGIQIFDVKLLRIIESGEKRDGLQIMNDRIAVNNNKEENPKCQIAK